jgi:signal transduction histidine kinase
LSVVGTDPGPRVPSDRGALRWLLPLIGVAGVGVGIGGGSLLLGSEISDGGIAFTAIAVLITWSFIGTGLFAWWHRPESRVGALMVAVGFAWAINSLTSSPAPGVFIAGVLLSNLWVVLLFQLLLTFPDGRLQSGYERLLLAGAWLSGAVLQVPPLLFTSLPDPDYCDGCPENAILIADNETAAGILFALQMLVAIPAVVGLLVLLVRRWRGATRAQRGAYTPVLWAGGITFALIAAQLASLSISGSSGVTDAIFLTLLLPFTAVPYAFLIGFLRTHLSRESAVSALLESLRDLPVHGGALRDVISEALGDPTLELAYWLPKEGRYADHRGQQVTPPDVGSDRYVSVVEREGRKVGALICDPALAANERLVDAVGAAAALALDNERLEAALHARVEELRASRARIVQAADAERRRLERNLHDGAQQQLVAVALSLRLARGKVRGSPEAAEAILDEAMDELEQATTELRELARGIHPAVLTDRGLRAAVKALAGRSPVPVELRELPGERLPRDVEAAAYFVVAEGLTNVARYAEARGASVSISRDNGRLDVEVRDDGRGGADPNRGSGLRGLADRVAALDGTLDVRSEDGAGTTLTARIPCA